jgi:hypothetical protein
MLADTTESTKKEINSIPAVRMGGIKGSKALLMDLVLKVELIKEMSDDFKLNSVTNHLC